MIEKNEVVKKICSYITLGFNEEAGRYEQVGARHFFEVYTTENRIDDLDEMASDYLDEVSEEYGNEGLDIDDIQIDETEYACEDDKLNYEMYGDGKVYEMD